MNKEKPVLRWHMIVLVLLLGVWGAWSFVGVAILMHFAPPSITLGLLEYYLFFSIPILISVAAYLLFSRSKYTIVPFLSLPPIYYFSALRLYPYELNLAYRPIDIHYFLLIPLPYRFGILFFLGCCIYYAYLRKYELVN
jgi:hypothetical protein